MFNPNTITPENGERKWKIYSSVPQLYEMHMEVLRIKIATHSGGGWAKPLEFCYRACHALFLGHTGNQLPPKFSAIHIA